MVIRGKRSPFRGRQAHLKHKISLVVPTYNVERYFDEFMYSVVNQSTGLHNVEIIIVNDGSPDNSGKLAKKWQKAYPKNIKYIHQENKGLSGARNTGLEHATGDWISFPDPDDFLHRHYFHYLNLAICKQRAKKLAAVCCNIIIFNEYENKIESKHPLKDKFNNVTTVKDANNLGNFIQMSSATTWINSALLKKSQLKFCNKVIPTFEDGHLLNQLFNSSNGYEIEFTSKAQYFYRKRADESSLVGGAKTKKEWYIDQLKYGYLDLINKTLNKYGKIPYYIQRTILYDISWRFRYLVDHPERLSLLSNDEINEFRQLLSKIFEYIVPNTIRTMNVGAIHEGDKLALLSIYKNENRANDFIYVTNYDKKQKKLQLNVITGGSTKPDIAIFIDGEKSDLLNLSKRTVSFLDSPYYSEHRFWIKVDNNNSVLCGTLFGRPVRIRRQGTSLGDRVKVENAIASLTNSKPDYKKLPNEAKAIRKYATSAAVKKLYAGCWILMDRDDAADDNAEHLYRYLLTHGLAKKAFFALRANSQDWDRLKSEGFKLLDFGSKEHAAAIVNADILASSHADQFILWPVEKSWIQDLAKYNYVFLQHGVTKDDLSRWLNPKPIKRFITASYDEWRSIASEYSNYIYSEVETKLTGFPRHDALLARKSTNKTILIMPTWRNYLVGETVGMGMKRIPSDSFMTSEYAKTWKNLLICPELKELAIKNKLTIKFCPHPNMAMYLESFNLPKYIECRDVRVPPSIQEEFAEAALVITDYSSIAFDCAYINKPIIYYQFDADSFFIGSHVYTKGYFDYEKNGFGPICMSHKDVIKNIDKTLNAHEDIKYLKRREDFFAFRDGRASERVYNEIKNII